MYILVCYTLDIPLWYVNYKMLRFLLDISVVAYCVLRLRLAAVTLDYVGLLKFDFRYIEAV
jgi:hypothetical protein